MLSWSTILNETHKDSGKETEKKNEDTIWEKHQLNRVEDISEQSWLTYIEESLSKIKYNNKGEFQR